MKRLLIVSNRLPVTVTTTDGKAEVKQSAGGLATGLRGPHEASGGLWIGWPGDMDKLDDEQRAAVARELARLRAVPVPIDQEEIEGYYTGLANGVLWPLFHYLIDRIPYQQREWETYQAINQRFANAVAAEYQPGDLVWVHDYQLMLVPAMIRAQIPDARIGFFLHIPFPASEVFRLLPWREEILRGILGADVVGFHTFSYLRQFINTLIHSLGLMPTADSVSVDGRDVKLGVYPMGIDAQAFDKRGKSEAVQEEAARLRVEIGDAKLLLGVDRLDYTKGIPRRLLAIERLLEREPELRGKVRFVQVAVPSRENVPSYETFTAEVLQLVGRINGRFSTPTSVPIHFLHQGFAQKDLAAFYVAADAMLVTPLRDGMNLVAKEFVASRHDGDGVLVLSEFAGAASEMGEALLVNPYDIEGTASTIARGLQMKPNARRVRMRALRERIFAYDVHRWANEFIEDLERSAAEQTTATARPPSELPQMVAQASRVLLLLDWDGTLLPFALRPEFAEPDSEILELLSALDADPRISVHVVSGVQRDQLEEWLGGLHIGLHAEHGLWSRHRGGRWHQNMHVDVEWKDAVRPLLRDFSMRTPGSLVEEKTASLAFHYRMADVEYGEWQARELKLHLAHVLSNMAVEIISGNRVVEVQPHGLNKGVVVPGLLAEAPGALVVAAGDDDTDEALFRVLPPEAISICVGRRPSAARFSIPSVASLRNLLRAIAQENVHFTSTHDTR